MTWLRRYGRRYFHRARHTRRAINANRVSVRLYRPQYHP